MFVLTTDEHILYNQAIHALAEKPTAIVSSTLTKTVLVSNYYFRIRCEAAMALVNVSARIEIEGLSLNSC